ncbi:2-oxoacid:acceptor oxidoreductase family protein [Desulforhopalus singaporensis]|uniref:2-oxoglutarate ferredoxin oxidoreductase, gamma subunit n=1 Tax=Desulforhopalus singaporensis TaxID=91360 RepID=A0A1H0L490_9BACT|nr:2-oxoacid:acceptor oxidoreductase family protein [Desulforhopalus singaporensis]SDO63049.1 2-oxoglutarate ferredoxin oxidoreductase, gamma subunit [Desulforhopalus singaporensis]
MQRTRIVFSGSGGQGVITAAIILAEAAVIHEGMNATQSQSYGAAARGGATRSDIIISEDDIFFPGVTQPNILICLTQEAYTTFAPIVRPGGTLLTDTRFVTTTRKVDAKQIELPIYESVMEKIGKPIVFNISVLGALLGIHPIVRMESLLAVVKERVPKDFIQLNTDAMELGYKIAENYLQGGR